MLEFLGYLIQGIVEALRLNPRAFEVVARVPGSGWVVTCIAILGGASLLAGQSVILFVSRVTPSRFVASLVVNGFVFSASLLIWAALIWLTGKALFPNQIPFGAVARLVGLGAAPYVFGFLVLIPYLGELIGRVLAVWSFLVVLAGLTFLAGSSLWPPLLCTAIGWLLVTALSRTIGRPIIALRRRIFKAVAGTSLDASVVEILAQYSDREREGAAQRDDRT